jgi:hypothetical protein
MMKGSWKEVSGKMPIGGLRAIYPVRNNAPLGFESQRLEFLTGFTNHQEPFGRLLDK